MKSFIEERGGKVLLQTHVKKILVKDHSAYGVKTDEGIEYIGRVVISNANAYDTFHKMMEEDEYLKNYLARMDKFSVSLSSFQVFLGLNKDLIGEIGTPLTNVRFTSNYRGAIYGWDQTLDNSNPRRLPHTTPIKNLYLSGAWTSPGHGYGGVIPSGLECFAEIMNNW